MPPLFGKRIPILTIAVFIILLSVFSAFPLLAASKDFDIPLKELTPPGNNDFEIQLSDLKRGERKKSRKQEDNSRKETKKTGSGEQANPREKSETSKVQPATVQTPLKQTAATFTSISASTANSVKAKPTESSSQNVLTPGTQTPQNKAAGDKEQKVHESATGRNDALPDEFQIIHEPYSFVVGGKRIAINVVVTSSQSTIQKVLCRFRATEKGEFARVQMKKAPGSLYTYTATLPPLSRNTGTFRYMILATDSLKREIRSQEFVIPLKMTMVIPGWQTAATSEKITVQLENPNLPFEGFFDISFEEVNPTRQTP